MFLNLGMMRHGGFTLTGAIHTSGIYPSPRLSESYVGQCWTPDQGGVYRVAGSGKAQVRGAKWQSSDSSFIAPDTYPTRSVRTRFGTAKVPVGTDVGMVSSPAFTNKINIPKCNPTGTTGLFADAGTVTISLANKATELAAAGLSQVCALGNVYRFQFTTNGIVRFGSGSASTGSTNKHSIRAVVLGSAGTIRINDTGGVSWTEKAGFQSVSALDITPDSTTKFFKLVALAGADIYLICPELVESSYLPADPIVPLTPAADTLAAFTLAAIYMEEDTAGVFPVVSVVETLAIGHADNPYTTQATRMSDGSVVPVVAGASWVQNFAVFGTCVPDAGGMGSKYIFSGRVGSNELSAIWNSSTTIYQSKVIAGLWIDLSTAYPHAANAPFDYLAIQTIHGMSIRVRPHATMTWSTWSANVTVNGKKPAPIGSEYQIGALNGAAGIAGKHPKVSIYELGTQASLAAYQDRAMLLAGRITG